MEFTNVKPPETAGSVPVYADVTMHFRAVGVPGGEPRFDSEVPLPRPGEAFHKARLALEDLHVAGVIDPHVDPLDFDAVRDQIAVRAGVATHIAAMVVYVAHGAHI